MSKSENSNRATQALRRRGQGVLKKSLDNRRRFIDGLELANAFGVNYTTSLAIKKGHSGLKRVALFAV